MSTSNGTSPNPAVRFKENLDGFFTHLKSIIAAHGADRFVSVDAISALRNLLAAYPIETVMGLFINNTQGMWDKIKERNPSFFTDFQTVLQHVPVKEISGTNLLFNIVKDPVVTDAEKTIMWEYCESFVYILVDYVHQMRLPKTRMLPDGTKQPVYMRRFIPQFSMRNHCKVWSIDLQF